MKSHFFQGIVHDRKLMREAQVNIAIRWFAGYRLDEKLPDHSSLTKIRQRWGDERFKKIFQMTIQSCVDAGFPLHFCNITELYPVLAYLSTRQTTRTEKIW